MAGEAYSYISSRLIKEVFAWRLDKRTSPGLVENRMSGKIAQGEGLTTRVRRYLASIQRKKDE
jgi:hypothetical protein